MTRAARDSTTIADQLAVVVKNFSAPHPDESTQRKEVHDEGAKNQMEERNNPSWNHAWSRVSVSSDGMLILNRHIGRDLLVLTFLSYQRKEMTAGDGCGREQTGGHHLIIQKLNH